MRVALIGYGQMGKEIEKILLEKGDEVVLKFDEANLKHLTSDNLKSAEIAFEFTHPEAAVANLRTCFKAGIPVVCGTTGWYKELTQVEADCVASSSALFYSPNFSIGVNLFWEAAKKLSAIMNKHSEYVPAIEEIHHIRKKDAPSGTAIKLAEAIFSELDRINGWVLHPEQADDKLVINAKREGDVPGTHILSFESSLDVIRLEHQAFGRKGFAAGAVEAARWLINKKGIFTMKDLLSAPL